VSLSPRQECLVRLNAFLSPDAARRILGALSPAEALKAPPSELGQAAGISIQAAARLQEQALAFDLQGELQAAAQSGARLLDWEDPEYPDLLRSVPEAPLLLYVKGRLEGGPPLAFVGSRRPTPYGLRMACRLAGEAAQAGCVVVSGLARGIDTQAHRAALKAGGLTWAVLGSGLGRLYPPENELLAREIVAAGGALVSELPIRTPPLAGHFPRRNRIVSGLSWGTVVVEGESRSGSLITARLALEQGREVFAVPGPADSRLSDAPHLLIAQGAKLVRTMAEVWEELPAGCRPVRPPEAALGPRRLSPPLAEEQEKILRLLGPEALGLEELGQAAGIDLPRLSNILFQMELEDLVAPVPGQRYAKKENP